MAAVPDHLTPPADSARSAGEVGSDEAGAARLEGRAGGDVSHATGNGAGHGNHDHAAGNGDDGHAAGDRRRQPLPVSHARKQRRAKSRQRALVEWVVAVGLAVLAAFVIKTWLVQAFVIPSGSMRPTLEVDDRVLVSKIAYRIGDPERGDVIVFDNPARLSGEPAQLIKRVVAVEGDEVETVDGRLVVNDQPVDEPYLSPGTATRARDGSDLEPSTVPDDHLYVMGDNRGDSRDSRFLGPIANRLVVGKAFFRLWPLDRLGRL
jgi:signal peptidase I